MVLDTYRIPQVMKYKLYLIGMLINSTPMAKEFMGTLFDNSCGHDFGMQKKVIKKDGVEKEIEYPREMWGNDVVTRGKRVDQFEEYLSAREEYSDAKSEMIVNIEPNNPNHVISYLRKAWYMGMPLMCHTYMIFPDPVTHEKLIDMDLWHGHVDKDGNRTTEEGELFAHDEKLAKKLSASVDMIKTLNSNNRLMSQAMIPEFCGTTVNTLLEFADVIRSNLGLPASTRAFFTGNGIHIYTKYDKKKIREWTGAGQQRSHRQMLVCDSVMRERSFVRTVGSMNLKTHMQLSFPLYGWDSIEEAFAMANPCFFGLRTSNRRIVRKLNKFDTTDEIKTEAYLSDIIENYRRCCVPSSSKNREYLKLYIQNNMPELATVAEGTKVYGTAVDRRVRWKCMRMAQEQYTLGYGVIKDIIGGRI